MRTRQWPVRITLIAGLGFAVYCAGHRPQAGREDPGSAHVDLAPDDLESIRSAAIRWYQEKRPEHWDAFIVELRRGAIFPERQAIGSWRCETSGGDLALARRQAPPAALFWGVVVRRANGGWVAARDFVGEEFWKR